MKIEKTTLIGSKIKLEPLSHDHLAGLAATIFDGSLWKIPVTFVPHPEELIEFLQSAESAYLNQKELAFATLDISTSSIVGSTRFRNIDISHKRVEIGSTFIAESWQKTYVNTEAKYLMLLHAFERWNCNRVEFLTDFLNSKSRNAITRIGGQEEGILRQHMLMRDGRVRDSVIYSIVKSEWSSVKAALELKLNTVN